MTSISKDGYMQSKGMTKFIVKQRNKVGCIYLGRINLPETMIGKKIMFKVEVEE